MASLFSSPLLSSAHQPFNIQEAQSQLDTLDREIKRIATPQVNQQGETVFNYKGEILNGSGEIIGNKIENPAFYTLAKEYTKLSGRITEAQARAASGATLSSPFPNISGSSGQRPGLGAAPAPAAPPPAAPAPA